MVDFSKLKRNKEIKELVQELIAFIEELMEEDGITTEEKQYAWKRLVEQLPEDCKPALVVTSSSSVMSYEDAQRWGVNTVMPFGVHSGKRIIDVPAEYLEWLNDQPDFRRQLHRFLASSYWSKEDGR